MAPTVNINFRMDKDLKKVMEKTCDDMGISMTAAFTIFAKKVAREKRIPFEVSADPFYSASNIHAIGESVEQLRQGKVVVKTMEELAAMAAE